MKTGDVLNLNLLPSQAKFQAAKMKLKAILRRYMMTALFIWLAIVTVVVILFFGSGLILNVQNKKYQQALSSYQSLSQDIILNQLLKYRAKVLGQVLKERFEYSSAFERINSIFSEKAKVSNFELNENKSFVIEVVAADKEAINYVESKVAEANEGGIEGIKKITMNSASFRVSGDWSVGMEVVLQ